MVPSCALALCFSGFAASVLQPSWASLMKGESSLRSRVLAADSEGERVPDVVHDANDVLANLCAGDVETHGLVAAGDVEADGGGADAVL